MSPSRGDGSSLAVQNAFKLFTFLAFWAPRNLGVASTPADQCFEQQYANRVAAFGSLHIVRRVGVISSLGGFYLAHFMDQEDAQDDEAHHQDSALRHQHLARRANGELVLIYSGHSAQSLEWVQLDLLASALRLQPILGDELHQPTVPPVLLVTACPAPGPVAPLSLPAPFTLRSNAGGTEQLQQLEQQRAQAQLANISPAYENELRINLRTFQNGLFLYSVADHGDHLVVQLSGGHAEVFFDFGGQQRSRLSGGLALNDGRWHELRWSHRFDTAELFVDGVSVNATEIGGLYRKLDLHTEVEIGGRPEDVVDEHIIEFALENAFHGCLARMELNGIDLLATAPKQLPICQMPRPQLVALGDGTSLQIPYSFLPFAFDFHVLLQSNGQGVPLLSILDLANSTLLQLRIEDGGTALSVQTILGSGAQAPKTIAIGSNSRGWHSVAVKLRGGDALELELDGHTAYWVEGHLARRIGSTMHTFLLSAVGCYRSATIDLDQGVPIGGQLIRDQCPLVERCSPNPCLNLGRCVQTGFASFGCECERNYTGRFCHISKLPHSCEEHVVSFANKKNAPERVLIDLDGGGPLRPFTVECRRRGPKRRKHHHKQRQEEVVPAEEVITVLRHDAPRTGVIVRGVSEPGAVRRVLDYGLGEPELDRMVGAFEQCAQQMRFQCAGGQRLMSYGNENRPSVWYASRNGQHGLQWGDAPPFSRMCPCALNESCQGDPQRNCNCDTGRDAVDSGINSHLQLLPVLQLFIGGGTEPAAMANVSIGPLECSGRSVFEAVTFMDRNLRLVTSHTFPSASTFHASLSIRLAHPQLTIFTYSSANHERWFQLFVRAGHLVGQLVYAGISHELVSDVAVDDNKWHAVSWEVDELVHISIILR